MDKFPETSASEEIQTPGWDSITAAFETLYPGQENPLHFASAFPWSLGGPNPLQGVSVYDGGSFFHLVTYGLSDLYEKESSDPEYSGYGFEFTLKLRKAGLSDEHKELRCIAGIFQSLAKMTFEKGEIFQPFEYIYTGQKTGVDVEQKSCLTGFVTKLDDPGEIDTPNGKVQFVELVGASDAELRAVIEQKIEIRALLEALGSDLTDYTRASVCD